MKRIKIETLNKDNWKKQEKKKGKARQRATESKGTKKDKV
jgi:hypothetical protein